MCKLDVHVLLGRMVEHLHSLISKNITCTKFCSRYSGILRNRSCLRMYKFCYIIHANDVCKYTTLVHNYPIKHCGNVQGSISTNQDNLMFIYVSCYLFNITDNKIP